MGAYHLEIVVVHEADLFNGFALPIGNDRPLGSRDTLNQ
jgi:hypothetical protein